MKTSKTIAEPHMRMPSDREVLEKKVLVVGLGISGFWAARCLADMGARVTVTEQRGRENIDPQILSGLENVGVVLEIGEHSTQSFLQADLIVVSPGVPHDTPNLLAAAKKGIPVIGEMELAARFITTPIIAVTGTNGKSSVTTWLGQMLANAGKRTFVGGNLGTPLSAYVARHEQADYIVAEVSSFQLDTTVSFCPEISILLNISPDHLDRYRGYDDYIRSKLRVFENQGSGHYAILNDDDPVLHAAQTSSPVAILRYGFMKQRDRQAFFDQGAIRVAIKETDPRLFSLKDFSLPGIHNIENLMAVVLAGEALGIDPNVIQQTISECKGLPHRLQLAGKKNQIRFYNDSKATNIDAAVRAIRSFDGPIILIAGGRHKGADYDSLVEAAEGNVKHAVFIGESRDLLATAFKGRISYTLAEDMKEAVAIAFKEAANGDSVLLAPACASFDMYSSYAQRGETFNNAVRELVHA